MLNGKEDPLLEAEAEPSPEILVASSSTASSLLRRSLLVVIIFVFVSVLYVVAAQRNHASLQKLNSDLGLVSAELKSLGVALLHHRRAKSWTAVVRRCHAAGLTLVLTEDALDESEGSDDDIGGGGLGLLASYLNSSVNLSANANSSARHLPSLSLRRLLTSVRRLGVFADDLEGLFRVLDGLDFESFRAVRPHFVYRLSGAGSEARVVVGDPKSMRRTLKTSKMGWGRRDGSRIVMFEDSGAPIIVDVLGRISNSGRRNLTKGPRSEKGRTSADADRVWRRSFFLPSILHDSDFVGVFSAEFPGTFLCVVERRLKRRWNSVSSAAAASATATTTTTITRSTEKLIAAKKVGVASRDERSIGD